jgi:hypothetical protein
VDTRVFLINLFKFFIETLSKNAVSQRTPSEALAEGLAEFPEEAKADIPERKEISFEPHTFNLDRNRNKVFNWFIKEIWEPEWPEWKDFRENELDLRVLRHYNYEENSTTFTFLLEKRRDLSKEWESEIQDFKTTKLQALKEVGDRAEKLNPSSDISDEIEPFAHAIYKAYQKGVLFEEIKEILQQKKAQTLQKKGDVFLHRPKPAEVVQPPDLSEIVPWGSKEKSGPASKYLQDNYGHLLKLYNRELDRDLICLQDLKVHDKTLWQGLYSEAKKTGIKPSEYVASKSQRTKEAALGTDIDKVRELEREAARQRQAMRRHGISLESLKNKP